MSNINESNIDHDKSSYTLPDEHASVLGSGQISGNNMTTKISRLSNKENRTSAEEAALQWLKSKNEKEIDKIDRPKRDRMETGSEGAKLGGNNFKKTHEKKGMGNPGEINGLAKMGVSGKRSKISDQIKNNSVEYYESYTKEIENMKYLIEYMNNNKPNII